MNYQVLALLVGVSFCAMPIKAEGGEGRRGHDEVTSQIPGDAANEHVAQVNDEFKANETPEAVPHGDHEMKGVHHENKKGPEHEGAHKHHHDITKK